LSVAAGLLWSAEASAQATFKCSTGTVNDAQHEWCKRLVARMEIVTNGALKGQVFPAGQLGGTPQQIQGVGLGTIEAFLSPPDFLVGIDPRFMALTAPYLFDSLDHQFRVLNDPEFRDKFLSLGESKGYKGISLLAYGPVGIALRTPAHSPDDLKGKKIRINATPIEQAMMGAFGASGVPMGLVEALQAAQQGVVDGVQSALPAITNFKFYELTKYHINTQHFYITSMAVVTRCPRTSRTCW
jgi:TRAP-type C4-dicarboxylate transport system substrate-binding protein